MSSDETYLARRAAYSMDTVDRGQLVNSIEKANADKLKMRPDGNGNLGLATVVNIDYEEFWVTLKTLTGTPGEFVRVPTPMTFPGAGARHFFGAMPQIGDHCIVGWMNQESSRPEDRGPVILAWMIPGIFPGRDWWTTAGLEKGEFDVTDPKSKARYDGAFSPIRHKLRHIQPGNIVGSSAQGSDIVLDEGVLLANRRGNEFRLRDQDQAAVTRALQRFDALAGVRTYHGMVQRDATLLAPYMVSDGKEWDAKKQMNEGEPIADLDLPPDPTAPSRFLTPAGVLRKTRQEGGTLGRPKLVLDRDLDPYEFLKRGGFLSGSGFVVDNKHLPSAIYGGKPIYRVASQTADNATLDPSARTLTEYRVEVTHTSDGRLPVTEQTDMFDADRLPSEDPSAQNRLPVNSPYIEWVLGSVVGNDPYSQSGRQQYGVPLKAVVFDQSGVAAPRLEPVPLPVGGNADQQPVAFGEQAATLFRLSPLSGGKDTFYSFNKKGQLKVHIGGPQGENSVEAYLQGSLLLDMGGKFKFNPDHFEVHTSGKGTIDLNSPEGAVVIYGGGPVKDSSATGERLFGTGRGEADLPSVRIEARTNALLTANKKVSITGQTVAVQGPMVSIKASQEARIDAQDRIGMSTQEMDVTVNGKMSEAYSGPKNLLPTNGALHSRTYAHLYMMDCENVLYAIGNRTETFLLGNHTTTIAIGNMTYIAAVGKYTAIAATSSLTMGPEGVTGTALAGNMTLTATAGAATLTGLASAAVVSLAGPAVVKGATSVYLGAPPTGTDLGPVICAGTREPFTNLPFLTWGLGAKTVIVGP